MGIGYVGDLKFSRLFDNNGTTDIISNGVSRTGGHEFTLDGIPNTDDHGGFNRVGFVPPADAGQGVKGATAGVYAPQGHRAGAAINGAPRSGPTNPHRAPHEITPP